VTFFNSRSKFVTKISAESDTFERSVFVTFGLNRLHQGQATQVVQKLHFKEKKLLFLKVQAAFESPFKGSSTSRCKLSHVFDFSLGQAKTRAATCSLNVRSLKIAK
jgi:hypothetical protein